jgi:hypothetical protein
MSVVSLRGVRSVVGTIAERVDGLEEATQAALRNESITRARVEALEARLTMFESMPLRKRLTWLLVGR